MSGSPELVCNGFPAASLIRMCMRLLIPAYSERFSSADKNGCSFSGLPSNVTDSACDPSSKSVLPDLVVRSMSPSYGFVMSAAGLAGFATAAATVVQIAVVSTVGLRVFVLP